MQNGYVPTDFHLRWGGQFSPAIRRRSQQSVQCIGVRDAKAWTKPLQEAPVELQ